MIKTNMVVLTFMQTKFRTIQKCVNSALHDWMPMLPWLLHQKTSKHCNYRVNASWNHKERRDEEHSLGVEITMLNYYIMQDKLTIT